MGYSASGSVAYGLVLSEVIAHLDIQLSLYEDVESDYHGRDSQLGVRIDEIRKVCTKIGIVRSALLR